MHSLVLALNPSIDVEWRLERVQWEEKNDVQSQRRWAGGKGVNVARWLKHLGGIPQLLLPLGGQAGDELAGYLRTEKIPAKIVRLREPTRVNIIVTTNARRQMRFNPPGPKLSQREWGEVLKNVGRCLKQTCVEQVRARHSVRVAVGDRTSGGQKTARPTNDLLILSGSLPRGVPVTAYAQLIRLAHHFGVKTLLDCDGPAFASAIKAHPFLVKPNEHELAQWWRKPLRSETELLRSARALSEQTRGWVLVSCGAKRSLLLHRAEGFQFAATPPRVKPRNTVGAGDALLAAVAKEIELASPPQEWLRCGLAAGTAATQCPPGSLSNVPVLAK